MDGFFIFKNQIHGWYIWIYYLSPYHYAVNALSYIQYNGATMDSCVSDQVCYGATGNDVLDWAHLNGTFFENIIVSLLVFVGYIFLGRFAGYLAL
eukprot:Awhi_evm2s2412